MSKENQPELPEYLKKLLDEPENEQPKAAPASVAGDLDRARAYVAKVPTAGEGERNTVLNGLAYRLAERFNLSEDQFSGLLLDWSAACSPPLSESEARATIRSAWKGCNRKGAAGEKRTEPKSGTKAAAPAAESVNAAPVLRNLANVKPQEVKWLWPGRIPLGKFTMLAGDPGLGKSYATLDMAARLSTGGKFPDQAGRFETGGTIILNAEDDAEDTIRPRLDAMNADVRRINVLDAVRIGGKDKHFDLASDLSSLESAIRQLPGTRLVIIDPISAYLGKTDSHKNSDVRSILSPLSKLIARLGVAVVGISHNSKGTKDTKAVYRSIGSIAFNAAARAVWSVQKDVDDPLRRLLLPVKMNLCSEPTGLAFRLVKATESVAVVEWESEPIDISADDALAAESAPRERKSDTAERWLTRLLADGPVDVAVLKEEAKSAGISSWRTVEAAKEELKVDAVRVGGIGGTGRWQWKLPDPAG